MAVPLLLNAGLARVEFLSDEQAEAYESYRRLELRLRGGEVSARSLEMRLISAV